MSLGLKQCPICNKFNHNKRPYCKYCGEKFKPKPLKHKKPKVYLTIDQFLSLCKKLRLQPNQLQFVEK